MLNTVEPGNDHVFNGYYLKVYILWDPKMGCLRFVSGEPGL